MMTPIPSFSELEQFVTRDDLFPLLEELTLEATDEFVALDAKRSELDFGPVLKNTDTKELAIDIYLRMRKLLQITPTKLVRIQYYRPLTPRIIPYIDLSVAGILAGGLALKLSVVTICALTLPLLGIVFVVTKSARKADEDNRTSRYDDQKSLVVIDHESRFRADSCGVFAHELTHHLQVTSMEIPAEVQTRAFNEGQAYAVQLEVSRELAHDLGNAAYLHKALYHHTSLLQGAYEFACVKNNRPPTAKLISLISSPDTYSRWHSKKLVPYKVGVAAFALGQRLVGKKFLAQTAHRDFSFLRK